MNIIKFKKMIVIVSLVMMIVSCFANVVYGENSFQPIDVKESGDVSTDTIKSAGGSIIGVLRAVGVVLSVVVLIIIGIKYMMGSAEEKAEYKKTLMPYIIGAVLIFTASVFAQVIYDFANNINSSVKTK